MSNKRYGKKRWSSAFKGKAYRGAHQKKKIPPKARKWISNKIRTLITEEKVPFGQAVAMAYSMAGYARKSQKKRGRK